MNFSTIAAEYEKLATLQKSASEILLRLLKIGENDDVLDLGCGTGHLTRKIRGLTKGRVVGIDPSEGMIARAIEDSRGMNITYKIMSAEEMNYHESFDVIFCNSAFQWFRNPERALRNCYKALRRGGRIGIQAPAKNVYCPNFIKAIEAVRKDERTGDVFAHFKEPWFFLETAEEYTSLFERCGFAVVFSKIERVVTEHTPEEVFGIFSSGAIAGYLNPEYYDVELNDEYIKAFREIVRQEFNRQAENGIVKLEFNRIFLVAVKDHKNFL
ncbi:class I SAM-dependent methyltransferase [Archaeoglobus neptunius]|uniref:class I SAM-dependent methyltransferase n=1 Tax=Archaeoglobus neptunius TaxID=2798580 RepID=UPI0019263F63|nr:class I SAM-dependent methyltransferase [Archaeoglobus neptunius]